MQLASSLQPVGENQESRAVVLHSSDRNAHTHMHTRTHTLCRNTACTRLSEVPRDVSRGPTPATLPPCLFPEILCQSVFPCWRRASTRYVSRTQGGLRQTGCVTEGASRRVRHAGCVTQGASRRVRHIGCVILGASDTGCVVEGASHWVHHAGCITLDVSHKGCHAGCIILSASFWVHAWCIELSAPVTTQSSVFVQRDTNNTRLTLVGTGLVRVTQALCWGRSA